jgi:pyruvate,water dikinase
VAQAGVDAFLRRYGMRGVGEIDLGRPSWRDDPTALMQALQSYLRIEDDEQAPDAVFRRGAEAAAAALDSLMTDIRRTRLGRLKAFVMKRAARHMRALAGLRESPKFTAISMLGVVRAGLLASGRELAAGGILDSPDDIFFLHLDELKSLATGETREWRAVVRERRRAHASEARRRRVPRVLLSDGRAFFGGSGGEVAASATLAGTPVSPGVADGLVRVVLDPRGAQLEPGEILVCRGTDPAWTPLFLAAAGLVTEVGGLMTHGSVVAREYGIPAVVGVYEATTRLRTGDRVRVDGTNGRVTRLDA